MMGAVTAVAELAPNDDAEPGDSDPGGRRPPCGAREVRHLSPPLARDG